MHDIDRMLQLNINGHYEEARALSDKLEALGPDKILDAEGKNTVDIWMRHCFNRGWFLLQGGKYQEGCQLLEYGRFLRVYGGNPLQTEAPIFNPSVHDIGGKSIILVMEGGFGDEIIHARFVKTYKEMGAGKVYLRCSADLVPLFERIEGCDGVYAHTDDLPDYDFWMPGFSAGWVAGHTFEDLPNKPYLTASDEYIEKWKAKLPDTGNKRIGIRWAGNPKFEHQQFRRFPAEFILSIHNYTGVDLYSLQRDDNTDVDMSGVVDLQNDLETWDDTAAAIMNMDLVITSCTSVAHLSAALGKETWVVVPVLPYHIWTWNSPKSTTSPYYQTARIFRQKKFGKWNEPFQAVYAALEERYGLPHIDLYDFDKEIREINLGCGMRHIEGSHNVDKSNLVGADEVVDLNVLPWPWKDNEYSHLTASNVLQQLGNDTEHFIEIIKEMYRVSDNGALWEIEVPHWRSDTALGINNKRLMVREIFEMLDQQYIINNIGKVEPVAFEHGLDVSVRGNEFVYTQAVQRDLESGEMDQEDLEYALIRHNNVAETVKILMQVHKPPRFKRHEYEAITNSRQK